MQLAAELNFADRLKELREAAGLSQYALAQRSGLSGVAIARLERSERQPAWETVRRLARALNVAVGEFDVGEVVGMPPSPDTAQPDAPELPEVLPEPGHVARGKFK